MLTLREQFIVTALAHAEVNFVGTIFYTYKYKKFEMKNSANILAALFLGMTVGAAVGILLAPAKGSDTRKKLAYGTKDLANNLKDKINWRKNRVKDEPEDYLEEYYRNIGLSARLTKGLA